jgi:small subunit ribosomal protein S20
VAKSLSPAKRHRQSLRRRERNRARRGAARSAVRHARELIAAGAKDEAETAIREASSILDRAARKGVLHPNNASRRKSRLARQLKTQLLAPAEEAGPAKRRARAAAGTRAGAKPKASAKKTGGRTTSKKS